jgi:hypothetical protein
MAELCISATALISSWKQVSYKATAKRTRHLAPRTSTKIHENSILFFLGHVLESLDDCLQFTVQSVVDPRLTWDLIVKYYLNASLLLW